MLDVQLPLQWPNFVLAVFWPFSQNLNDHARSKAPSHSITCGLRPKKLAARLSATQRDPARRGATRPLARLETQNYVWAVC